MSDPRTDMEERLADALAHGAHAAPSAVGLAAAARTRARQRRRTRLAGAAALVVLAVGVPAGVVAMSGGDRPGVGPGPAGGSKATDPIEGSGGTPNGYHVESWHSVTIEAPNTWEYGPLTTWCSGGGSATDSRISRPGVAITIACSPLSSYGVEFAPSNGNDVQWPVAAQHSDSWPDGAYVGATTRNGVVVTVAARKSTVTQAILDSVQAIGPDGDPNGCTSSPGEARPDVAAGAIAICRYDAEGLLEQSELLTGDDVKAANTRLESARSHRYSIATRATRQAVVRMHSVDLDATVDLGGSCALIHGLEGDRQLTADVLYWALSPGWTGAVGAEIPLPAELRQR